MEKEAFILVELKDIPPNIDIDGTFTIDKEKMDYGETIGVDIELVSEEEIKTSDLEIKAQLPEGMEISEVNIGKWEEGGRGMFLNIGATLKHDSGTGKFLFKTKVVHKELGIELTVLDPFTGKIVEINDPDLKVEAVTIEECLGEHGDIHFLQLPQDNRLSAVFTYPSAKKESFEVRPMIRHVGPWFEDGQEGGSREIRFDKKDLSIKRGKRIPLRWDIRLDREVRPGAYYLSFLWEDKGGNKGTVRDGGIYLYSYGKVHVYGEVVTRNGKFIEEKELNPGDLVGAKFSLVGEEEVRCSLLLSDDSGEIVGLSSGITLRSNSEPAELEQELKVPELEEAKELSLYLLVHSPEFRIEGGRVNDVMAHRHGLNASVLLDRFEYHSDFEVDFVGVSLPRSLVEDKVEVDIVVEAEGKPKDGGVIRLWLENDEETLAKKKIEIGLEAGRNHFREAFDLPKSEKIDLLYAQASLEVQGIKEKRKAGPIFRFPSFFVKIRSVPYPDYKGTLTGIKSKKLSNALKKILCPGETILSMDGIGSISMVSTDWGDRIFIQGDNILASHRLRSLLPSLLINFAGMKETCSAISGVFPGKGKKPGSKALVSRKILSKNPTQKDVLALLKTKEKLQSYMSGQGIGKTADISDIVDEVEKRLNDLTSLIWEKRAKKIKSKVLAYNVRRAAQLLSKMIGKGGGRLNETVDVLVYYTALRLSLLEYSLRDESLPSQIKRSDLEAVKTGLLNDWKSFIIVSTLSKQTSQVYEKNLESRKKIGFCRSHRPDVRLLGNGEGRTYKLEIPPSATAVITARGAKADQTLGVTMSKDLEMLYPRLELEKGFYLSEGSNQMLLKLRDRPEFKHHLVHVLLIPEISMVAGGETEIRAILKKNPLPENPSRPRTKSARRSTEEKNILATIGDYISSLEFDKPLDKKSSKILGKCRTENGLSLSLLCKHNKWKMDQLRKLLEREVIFKLSPKERKVGTIFKRKISDIDVNIADRKELATALLSGGIDEWWMENNKYLRRHLVHALALYTGEGVGISRKMLEPLVREIKTKSISGRRYLAPNRKPTNEKGKLRFSSNVMERLRGELAKETRNHANLDGQNISSGIQLISVLYLMEPRKLEKHLEQGDLKRLVERELTLRTLLPTMVSAESGSRVPGTSALDVKRGLITKLVVMLKLSGLYKEFAKDMANRIVKESENETRHILEKAGEVADRSMVPFVVDRFFDISPEKHPMIIEFLVEMEDASAIPLLNDLRRSSMGSYVSSLIRKGIERYERKFGGKVLS